MNLNGRNFLLDVSEVAPVYLDRRIDACLAAPLRDEVTPDPPCKVLVFSNVYTDSLPA
jgi:hypothetical protein